MEQSIIKRRTIQAHDDEQRGNKIFEEKKKPEVIASTSGTFFTWDIIQIVLVHSVAGIFFGYNLGLPGPYYTFVKMNFDCSATTSEVACTSLNPGLCAWKDSSCSFVQDNCSNLVIMDCDSNVAHFSYQCLWDAKKKKCRRLPGYTAVENGIFAGGLIVGGCIGSLGASTILSYLGRRKTFLLCGILASFAATLTHFSTYTEAYVTVIAGRIFAGIASGILCVASPMYVEEMVQGHYKQIVGIFFQIAVTVGILLAATMAYALNPQDLSLNLQMQQRRQGLCVFASILSLLICITGIFMRESPYWVEQVIRARGLSEDANSLKKPLNASILEDDTTATTNNTTNTINDAENSVPSWSNMIQPLFTAFIMCIAQQMTGINAIMNYAPTITAVMGLAPLTGNFIVMAWNFVAVLLSIPVSLKYRADYTYICAVFFTSLSCLLTGIPLLPSLDLGDKLKRALSAAGIAIFIVFFEVGMGTFFWVLSQGIFPPAFRDRGSSFTVLTQFLFNILINVGFPIAVGKISGTADQDKGMSIVFICFGCIGLVSSVYLSIFLRLREV
ncbi:Major facilitator [Trypanosoma melophagium]|uniref:Major facilitator n=1 Tax=Trypanosoma melophagium TaxID=715481 RepID=UPI00351AA316|nr:Major facilitator [Trypanosoma melophagium]